MEYITFLDINTVDSRPIMHVNNHANSMYGYFDEVTSSRKHQGYWLGPPNNCSGTYLLLYAASKICWPLHF